MYVAINDWFEQESCSMFKFYCKAIDQHKHTCQSYLKPFPTMLHCNFTLFYTCTKYMSNAKKSNIPKQAIDIINLETIHNSLKRLAQSTYLFQANVFIPVSDTDRRIISSQSHFDNLLKYQFRTISNYPA